MKRLFFCIPLIALTAGCAASAGTATPDLDRSFSAEAEINYGGSECTVQMRRMDKNDWEFCVTSPYALEGLVISVRDGVTKLSMYDMNAVADINIETVSVAKLLSDAYEAAACCTSAEKDGEGQMKLSGQAETSIYTLCTDGQGVPLSLSLNGQEVTAEFTKYAELEREEAYFE